MPRIRLPKGDGDWTLLDSADAAELWKLIKPHPDRLGSTTFYVVGSEHTPETVYDQDLAKAEATFTQFRLKNR